ncbi:chemotaxis protein CheW [Endozoicomonas ascidiicola]|uniref:chemotaxis protein CheW n=1 Tax=Endozoicomonas ascidiicola TaxID=1698521 RepID=UPI00082ACC2B|nr:chemotaxis protein CheW [Endozoicomonas ascidiicola]
MTSVLLPIQQRPLLIPAVCLAGNTDYIRPEDNYPELDWLLGDIRWRGEKVPVISFERMNKGRFTEFSATNRIAIINRTTKGSSYGFYGLVVQGIPQPLTIVKEELRNSAEEAGPMEQHRVILKDIPASIPNLTLLEQALEQAVSARHTTAIV